MSTASLKFFERDNITIAIGPNGCGKSFWLREIAKGTKGNVIAIATSPEHKLNGLSRSGVRVLNPNSFNYRSSAVLRRILLSLSEDKGKYRYAIGNIFRYIGFDERLFIETTDFVNNIFDSKQPTNEYEAFFGLNKYLIRERKPLLFLNFKDSLIEDFSFYYKTLREQYSEKDLFSGYYLSKKDEIIPFRDCSSGELQLLRTLTFIQTHITEGSTIIIDEPENSLHPKWQFEYIRNLLDTIHMYNPRIYIATHSPIIIDGLINQSDEATNRPIEALISDYFDIITPKSYKLNEQIADLIEEFARETKSTNSIVNNLIELRDQVKTSEQFEILSKVIDGISDADKIKQKR